MVLKPLASQGLLINGALGSHSDTTQSEGPLWTSDRPFVEETSSWEHTTLRETSILRVGFEPAVLASDRLQTHALDRVVTGIGSA